MTALSIGSILLHGIVFSIGIGIIILGGMYLNPRVMLQDYPKEIQAKLPPLSKVEKRQQAILGGCFYVYMLVVLLYSNSQLVARAGRAEFLPIFINTYLIFAIFNLFDLFVLDYLVVMVFRPKALFIPEAQGMEQYNTFQHHFHGFLIGLVVGLVISVIVTVISLLAFR